MRYIARTSYGNDSVAMLQLMREHGLKDVVAVNNDTGWASLAWPDRVARGEEWVRSMGWQAITLPSVGFEQNVFDQTEAGMFPTRQRQHCTKYLKILPFLKWVKTADPDKRALICVGVRRAESAARANHPAFIPEKDDGRHVWHPLIDFSDEDRDGMVAKTPLELLPHKSDECAICINAARPDLRRATPRDIERVAALERKVGRPMFNPAKFMGAEGIHEVKRWADSERGAYRPPNLQSDMPLFDEIDPGLSCDDNWCGL